MRTALIAGYSGLVGHELILLLLSSDYYDRVIGIGRRKIALDHDKFQQFEVDFDNLILPAEQIDHVFCCLGTTIKKAGSKDQFRLVDFQYPVNLASTALVQGATRYFLVTAQGANAHSAIFYNKVKGEVEEAICQIGYASVDIFRPSLLLGKRNERRVAERIGQRIAGAIGFLMVGPMADFKAIQATKVARAMLFQATQEATGCSIHSSGSMQKIYP